MLLIEKVRDVIARALYQTLWAAPDKPTWESLDSKDEFEEDAEEILRTLEKAGFIVVQRAAWDEEIVKTMMNYTGFDEEPKRSRRR